MKKILLGTSTLVASAALFAGAAFAGETPKVTIGGVSDFQAGYVSEDLDTGLRAGAFRQETDLSIKFDAKTDAGLGYGGEIVLPASNTSGADTNNNQVGKSYVYVDGAWGRFEGGSNYGANSTLKVDASKIARATGGIDGDWTYFFSSPNAQFLATPDGVLDYGAGSYGDESSEAINKVTYYTPRFAGFQAGVSYLFDTNSSNRGINIDRGNTTAGQAKNVVVGGVNYDNKFGDVSVAGSLTGEYGKSESAASDGLHTYAAGAKVGYMGFSVAGSYGSWGDSLNTKAASDSASNYWTAGVAYETGPFGASVTYLNSKMDTGASKNKLSNISVGVDYKLAPGLTPYAEVSFIDANSATAPAITSDNQGTVVIVGTSLAF